MHLISNMFGRMCLILCIHFLILISTTLILISRPFENHLGLFLQMLTYFGNWRVIYPLQDVFLRLLYFKLALSYL